jgi:broad specificity phosphatase PhoE
LKKTIYLIRHGETAYNRRGVVQGSGIDADLNELGHLQAQAFYDAYNHLAFQKIYTSALRRTVQSVQQFIDTKNLPHHPLAGLNEISWGIREGKIPSSNDSQYYRQLTQSWRAGQTDLRAEGGESPEDVQVRVREALSVILSNVDENLVLVAMHGRAMRVLLATIFEQPLELMDNFPHHNLCLYVIHYEYNTQKFSIEKTNDTSHLAHLHS